MKPFAADLCFPEGPRWHDGALWCSDVAAGRVLRFDAGGRATVVVDGLRRPSGLGWLPDGRLLVVEGDARRILRDDGADGWRVHADLSGLVGHACNDMVVDGRGRAWVGNFGFDFEAGAEPAPTRLVAVGAGGHARLDGGGLVFPNGSAVTPDGGTLIVAETHARRLSAFDIADDGALSGPRTWAALDRAWPDGIALDAEGAVWLASPPTRELLRVREGGEVVERIATDDDAIACALGGDDRRTLFVLTAPLLDRSGARRRLHVQDELRRLRAGAIATLRVAVPGAGWP